MSRFVVTDEHHQVLTAWEKCSQLCSIAPAVISLDFHTDVLYCCNRGIPLPENSAEALQVLHHDEHFDWALRKNIIRHALIISLAPCAVAPVHPALEVVRHPELPPVDVMLNDAEKFRQQAEMVLDDRFLGVLLEGKLPDKPYILDIDCDFIMCEAALHPEKSDLIRQLAGNAELITVSKEEAWVKILRLPGEKITGTGISDSLRWLRS